MSGLSDGFNTRKRSSPYRTIGHETEYEVMTIDELSMFSGNSKNGLLRALNTFIVTSIRLLNVPLVYRTDTTGDGNNNQKSVKLFGHPALLKLPNQLSTNELYDAVSMLHPFENSFKLLLVDGQVRTNTVG